MKQPKPRKKQRHDEVWINEEHYPNEVYILPRNNTAGVDVFFLCVAGMQAYCEDRILNMDRKKIRKLTLVCEIKD
jgi:hypothetical protein